MAVSLMALYPDLFKVVTSLAGVPFGSANDFMEAFKVIIDGVNKTPQSWTKLITDEHISNDITYPKLVIVHGSKNRIVSIDNSYELIKQWTA
jgi:hypothetical protein